MPASVDSKRPPQIILSGSRVVRKALILLVLSYRMTLGPFLGGQCRFEPSCSQYALDVLRTKPAWKAVGLIVWRILRCQPLCKGGFDFVKSEPEDEWYRIS